MKMRILTATVMTAASFIVVGCGESKKSAENLNPQLLPAPAVQAPVQPTAVPAQVQPAAMMSAVSPVAIGAAPVPAVVPAATQTLAKSDKLVIQGFASQVHPAWTPSQPSSTMRVAQFSLPPAAGADAGELAAYFFPTGQGGSHEANIERWASQFVSADGKPVTPQINTGKSGDTEVTVVELQGTYARGVGMGPTGDAKPNQTLMIAMVETAIGRITLQMYGPSKTVSAQRDHFLKLAKGFRPA